MSGSGAAVPRVFVSHSHEDNAFGVKLVEDLRAALGGDETIVWYDVAGGLHAGEAWWEKIVAEITARPIFIVILSPDAMASPWVNREITMAVQLATTRPGRLIIPLLHRPCEVRADVATIQYASFLPPRPYTEALAELVARLRPNATHDQHTPQTVPPRDPAAALVAQMLPQIEEAMRQQDWLQVVDKIDFLQRHAAAAIPPTLYRTFGEVLLRLGDVPRARQAVDAALALDPRDIPTFLAAAHVRRLDGHAAEALPLLRDALALVDPTDRARRLSILTEYTDALSDLGQWDELLRRVGEAERLAPDDPVWPGRRLLALTKLGRTSEALDVARELTARPGASAAQWIGRAHLEAELGQDDAAHASVAAAQRLAPGDPAVARAQADLLPPVAVPDRLASLGFVGKTAGKTQYILPPTRLVAAGEFLMGSEQKRDKEASDAEMPQRSVMLPAYRIGTFPVTVAEYAYFVQAGQSAPQNWQQQTQHLDYPVVYVSWRDAVAYAAWLAKLTGQPWRLPTEAEWEKAARGSDGRIYPWGDAWDHTRANTSDGGPQGTTPVGSYPSGASPCGAQDMAGNVWEWTSSVYEPYPYTASGGREDPNSTGNRVLRGGSWDDDPRGARVACRFNLNPDLLYVISGFRLAVALAG